MADETLYLATGETPARLDRWWIDRIFSEGVSDVQAGDFAVTERAQGANLSVDVAAGEAIVAGSTIADQGKYLTRQTSGVNVALEAPPLSDSRIDLIVRRVRDSSATGADASNDGSATEPVSGVAASSPVAPDAPDDALALAEVVVAAGVSSVTGADITDRRVQLNATTLKVGTEFTSMSTAERDALSGAELFEGRAIYNTGMAQLEVYDGDDWVPVGRATDIQTFASSGTWTKPASAVRVEVILLGAGGGGGAGSGSGSGSGAGGGGYLAVNLAGADVAASVPVSVGAGGAGSVNSDGSTGGASSFGVYSASGGSGGDGDSGPGGDGGTGTGGADVPFFAGGDGGRYNAAGAGSVNGGGGGGGGSASFSGDGTAGGGPGTIALGTGAAAGVTGADGARRQGGGGGSSGGGGSGGVAAGGGGGSGGNAPATGPGGDGGRGEVVVITYF